MSLYRTPRSVFLFAYAVAAVAAVAPFPASAQAPVARLGAANATFPEPFSAIAGLRELSDGHVVLADRLEKAVRILDFDAGTFADVGRAGGGPGEYEMPGRLFPLPGDSTLLVDLANMRLSTVTPDGQLVGSTSMQHPSGTFIRPDATDAAGRVYFRQTSFSFGGGGLQIPDSIALLRWDRRGAQFDSITRLPLPQTSVMQLGSGAGSFRGPARVNPYPAEDVWTVSPDGQVAFVRAAPYRVDWVREDGRVRRGPVVPYTPVRVTDDDKRAWEERPTGHGAVIAIGGSGGGSRSRSITIPQPSADEAEWPEVKPAFPERAARTTPEGELWVERHVRYGEPARYDVFDAQGRRVRQVELPADRRLIGFGAGTAYLVHEDADGLQWLERYVR